MITKLTPEQTEKMKDYVTKWVDIGLSTSQVTAERTTEILNNFYKVVLNLPNPTIVIKESPIDCWDYICEQTGHKMNFVFPYTDGQFYSSIFSYYDFLINELNVEIDKEALEKYNCLLETSELNIFYCFDDICVVSKKPTIINMKDEKLHCENGPAISYNGKLEVYALNGVKMDKEYVMTPAEQLTGETVLKEKNAEVRRELVRKIGIERVAEKLNTKIVDTQGDYELLMIEVTDNEMRPYLKMKNPSIGVYHIEGVHPNCKTVKDALNWRNGTTEDPTIVT